MFGDKRKGQAAPLPWRQPHSTPPHWAFLPDIAVSPGPSEGWPRSGASRCWLNEAKQEGLTVHETQLVVDKTQHHVHDGAEL